MSGSKSVLTRLGGLPWGLIASVALIAAIESFVAGRGAWFRDAGDWGWAVTEKAARVHGQGREILAFGDSLAKMGIVPSVIEARTGRTAYNLAVTAGQAPSSYFLFRKALDSGAKPRAVLVDFFPRLMQLGPRHTPYWPAVLGPREAMDLAWEAGDPDLFASIVAPGVLPSLRARHGLRAAIRDMTGRPWGSEASVYRRNWRENLGAQLMPCGADPNVNFPQIRQAFYSDVHFDPVNLTYIHRFLDLAAAHSIRVYYLIPPIKPGLQAECDLTGFNTAYQTFLENIQIHHPDVVMVDGRRAGYDPALFHDANHLGRDGAWAYSTAIGDLLRRHPPEAPAPAWVSLPAYVGLPGGSPPEDLNQSRAALIAVSKARKVR